MHTATRGPGRRKHHYSNTLNTTEVRGGRGDWEIWPTVTLLTRCRAQSRPRHPPSDWNLRQPWARTRRTDPSPGGTSSSSCRLSSSSSSPSSSSWRSSPTPSPPSSSSSTLCRPWRLGWLEVGRIMEASFLYFQISSADNVTDQHQEESSQVAEEINWYLLWFLNYIIFQLKINNCY